MRTPKSSLPDAKASKASPPTIREGDSGDLVTLVQAILTNKHIDCGPVDGIFGKKTTAGVKVFQRARRLTPDGIVGPKTWAALGSPNIPPGGRDSTTGA